MKIAIVLHSVTGNTDLVARHAQRHLASAGHAVSLFNIRLAPDLEEIGQADLLGVASPTMYFRSSFVMDAFLRKLPESVRPRPAFLLATAAGEPGAHFELQAQLLHSRGYRALGAHWTSAPSNWPPQRVACLPMALSRRLGRGLARLVPALRPALGMLWPDSPETLPEDREALESFLERMLAAAERGDEAPLLEPLYRPWLPGAAVAGRRMTPTQAAKLTATRIDPRRCTHCGTCVEVCPVACITWGPEETTPQVGSHCVGCWACYHHCPAGAVRGWLSPGGLGRYSGPSPRMREVFGRR